MPVFCLFTLGRHGNFTAGVTSEQPYLLCTALALNIELLSIIVCAVLETSYQNMHQRRHIRIIGSYIRSWERPGDLPRVIEILCLFASGAQRNERKDNNFYHEWKITRAFPTTHVSTYFFRKQTTFTIANSQRRPPLVSN